jgi:hypothetical protein
MPVRPPTHASPSAVVSVGGCPEDAMRRGVSTRGSVGMAGPLRAAHRVQITGESMDQLSTKALVTFGLVACCAILSASGCGCVSHSPAQDARGAKKEDGSNSDSIVAPPIADTVDERPHSRSLPRGDRPASSDAVAPAADPPISSIPSLVRPGAGDTPINSGAGDATPLESSGRVRVPNDTPQ